MLECQQLKSEYSQLETLKQEFETAFDEAVKTGNTEKAKQLKTEIQEKLKSLKEKIVPREIKAIFINPETSEQKEIIINIQEKTQEAQEFYKKHNLPIPNEQEIMSVWRKNHKEIKEEIEKYGYDNVLIIPEDLPDTENLHNQMTEGYNASWTSGNFDQGGGFAGSKHTEQQKVKIILCHNDQNIYQNQEANVFEKATLNKNIMQLSGLTEQEINQKIQNQENIPINFETEINNQKIQIQAEGLSLNEYFIFQRQYFEKNQKHLDENGWTWLLKTFSASRVVNSYWYSGAARLRVYALDLDDSGGDLACRLSRSFSN
ncbi:MAG: hypothetical protein US25_C0027G0004 [Candidatus Moranbacteria bacterium GW2011_GWE1_36_7]|nr:MAG: hypothetical protein UR99_C0056G0003 [Candidatus Moranbacteria bacterium GW2011_GWD2_36_12]KKQ04720.1 MAG: hypothetical protein US16_C0050G0004 [Candidatus Moranbacteria bacterium GW2011_GWE2_36_40]KKQ14339.1 MAG: hypothetical protein US25_C0027G0004 [Candidatus Moranbacteria bacterium GW2011_GWE1_36_7]